MNSILYKEFSKNTWELGFIPIFFNFYFEKEINEWIKNKYDINNIYYSFPYTQKIITNEGRIMYKASSRVYFNEKEVNYIEIEAEELF